MSNAPAVYGYHAHVYYDAATLPVAEKLKAELGARFDVELGPNSGERVGPHPVPQFQMIFKNEQFQTVVPWLMLNRESLDILIHPLTNDMVDDHTVYALWLGTPVKLVLDTMRRHRAFENALHMISGIERIGWIAGGSRILSVDILQKRLYRL